MSCLVDHKDHDQPYLLGPDPLAQMRCAIHEEGELSQMTVRQGLRKSVAHPQQLPTCGVADMGQSPIMRDHAPVLSDRKTTCDCCAIAQALAIFARTMLSDLSLSVETHATWYRSSLVGEDHICMRAMRLTIVRSYMSSLFHVDGLDSSLDARTLGVRLLTPYPDPPAGFAA